jgi:ribonuclease HII
MICGVDEAGRGPVIGPLVVAGVAFEDDSILIENNVKDSKKITSNRRNELSRIIKHSALNYEIIIIPASDIDDMRKILTLNEIEVNVFSKIIDKLKPDICYVDAADVNDKRFGDNILSKLKNKTKIISEHKADNKFPIVGAASILAKTIRDEEIFKIEKILVNKLNIPMGSGYPADPATKYFLDKWFETFRFFPKYVRKSWKTSQNIIKKYKNSKLNFY